MDENRIEGTARNLGGKAQEGFGRVTGDAKTKTEGMMNQAAGNVTCGRRNRLAPRQDA